MSDRWATFDCYGTIADWHGGMRTALQGVVGDRADTLLAAYHEHEPVLEAEKPHRLYRDVLTEGLRRGSASSGIELPAGQEDALVRAWPSMPFHADAPGGLVRLREAGWKLAVLTNCDDDLWATTAARLPLELDLVITAQQVAVTSRRKATSSASAEQLFEPRKDAGCMWPRPVRRHGGAARPRPQAIWLELESARARIRRDRERRAVDLRRVGA